MEHLKNKDTLGSSLESEGVNDSTIKHKASNAWRFIWAGVGVIGTLSGVLGVYEFLSGSNSPQLTPMTSQEMIVAMVENRSISVEEATRLAKVLAGDNNEVDSQSTESIQKITSEGTDKQREALSLLSESHTRTRGLALLKEEAKTSEDWQVLSRFAKDTDQELALMSIKNSLTLEPENFESLTMLAKLQAENDDFSAAIRSITTAELMAESPYESLLASRSKLDIAHQALDIQGMKTDIEVTKQKLDVYEQATSEQSLPRSFKLNEYRQHPVWVRAVTHQALATMYNFIDRDAVRAAGLHNEQNDNDEALIANNTQYSEEAIEQASSAIDLYHVLESLVNSEDSYTVIYNNIISHNHLAFAYLTRGDAKTGAKYSNEMLQLVRQEAETGNRKAIEDLPKFYSRHAAFLARLKDNEGSLKTKRRSVDLQTLYLRKYEDKNLALKIAKIEFDYALSATQLGKPDMLESRKEKYLIELEAVIGENPDEDNYMIDYAVEARRMSAPYDRQSSSELKKALAALNRASQFIDRQTELHGVNHGRLHAKYYTTIYKGDIYFFWKEKQLALAEFQKALNDAEKILPTEKEPDVVVFSRLEALYRIGNLNIEQSEQAIIDGIKLAKKLDKAKKLTTTYQAVLNELMQMADKHKITAL